jgi:hypothetical protein
MKIDVWIQMLGAKDIHLGGEVLRDIRRINPVFSG